jgi:Tat protein translocase TatB subunit
VFNIGMTELLVILVVGLLVLGPKRLPELARSLGRGLAEFRRASTDMRREFLDVQEEMRIDRVEKDSAAAKDEPVAAPEPVVLPADTAGGEPKSDSTPQSTAAAVSSPDTAKETAGG